MFESNPYAMVGVAMIAELHRTVSAKAAVEETKPRPYRAWRHRLARVMVNLWPGKEGAQPYADECEMGCI